MRLLLLLVPLALASVPQALAWTPSEWTALVEDAEGDVDDGGSVLFPRAPDPHADLVEVAVREEGGALLLRLTTAAGDAAPPPGARYESLVSLHVEPQEGLAETATLHATARGFRLALDGKDFSDAVEPEAGATPTGYVVRIDAWPFLRTSTGAARLTQASAEVRARAADGHATTDDAQGRERSFSWGGVATLPFERPWRAVAGADHAAGPSVAPAPDGSLHVAYVVYRHEPFGSGTGLFHGVLRRDGFEAHRVADARMPSDLHQDDQTQTAIAVDADGGVHILFEPAPNTDARVGVRYATDEGGGWSVENPAVLAGGQRLAVEDGVRASPSLTVGGGRVVAALQGDDGSTFLVERGQTGWRLLRALDDARLARVRVDDEGTVHAAWLRITDDRFDEGRAAYGRLLHASEAGGWTETLVAEGVEDRSRFWSRSDADGSFAFALSPDGTPHFVFAADRGARGHAALRDGVLVRDPIPLVADHGNPPVRMRMAFDPAGAAHVVTGYGGSDLYAVRSPEGAWHVEPFPAREMFDLALTPDGRAAVVHTEPHGGATLALAYQPGGDLEAARTQEGDVPLTDRLDLPVPGLASTLTSIAALALWRRR